MVAIGFDGPASANTLASLAEVTDGDTIRVNGKREKLQI